MAKGTKRREIPEHFTEKWLARIDGRLAVAKMLNARAAEIESDLGGKASLSYMQRSLVSRAIFLEQTAINYECRLAAGESVNNSEWLATLTALQRVYSTLGIRRVAHDMGALDLAGAIHDARGDDDATL